MKSPYFILFITFSFSVSFLKADEGMYLPFLIQKKYEEMQKLGIRLTPEQIYSINNSSLKDAIVNFGNFCTGEVISRDGLLLTNHHCGFDAIQSLSSVQNDLLTKGFWALSRDQELPSQGLTVTFLIRVEDVTEKILSEVKGSSDWNAREEKIEEVSNTLASNATEGTHYNAEVKSFYEGNVYYLFVYETFRDVRMVGAPPSSIGKFGGDTDNWMWPRHTGDFSLFRIYSGPDGKPAEYSKENIPLKPRHHLPVSLKGVKQGDFTMIMGYPGGTDRYMTSMGVQMAYELSNPARIKIREERLDLMKKAMNQDEKVKLMYAAKYAQISNYYKYFIGQNEGIRRLDVIEKKKAQEKEFMQWVKADKEREKKYGNLLADYEQIYKDYRIVNQPYVYLEEALFGIEALELAYKSIELFNALQSNAPSDEISKELTAFAKESEEHFKDYYKPLDKKIFGAMMEMYYKDVDPAYHPAVIRLIAKKYKGNFTKYADVLYKTSIFSNKETMDAFMKNPSAKVILKDPVFTLMASIFNDFRAKVVPQLRKTMNRLDETNNKYLEAILLMKDKDKLYPDANFTMRITYGTVRDYFPRDAVHYDYITTIEGVMEKEDPSNEEFIVSDKLKELYRKKDFGRYGQNGKMPVCFISNNDITGGNSGSPVINAEGHLIGVAFDGNWEAMSGDIVFEPELQRTISTDIRYVLFIIDKFAGAGYLIKEMTIVGPEENKASENKVEQGADIKVRKVEQKKKELIETE